MKINKNIILLSAISFNVALSIALVKSFLSIYLHEIGITLISIGLIYAAGAIAAGILRLPLGGLISKYGPKPLMIIGAACYPLFAIGVSIAETTPFFIVLKIIFEIVGAVFWTAFWVYLYDTIIKGEEGRSITFTGVFRKLPFFIGPFIAGIIISLFGFKNLFYLSAVIGIISVFVVSMVKDYLGVDSVLIGVYRPGDNLHAPNEKLHLPTWERMINTIIYFLSNVGEGTARLRTVGHY